MSTYIVLTDGFVDVEKASEALDGIDPDASAPERNRQMIDALGGDLREMYYTGGEYDTAIVAEFPDQDTLLNARHEALRLGVEDITVLDAVDHEDAEVLTAE